ncbi:MAG: hypothetical protein GXP08_13510 [Gammaproteobacteria bacterium]|nr:hypothetical protein [Gammaproteobacteria bacterium]
MTKNNDLIEIIEVLQNSQNNIKVYLVVPMGVLMILYFFSYATLIDHGMYGLLIFEVVSSLLFIFAIIKINQLSFGIIKFRFKNRPPYSDVLSSVDYIEFSKKPEEIFKQIERQRQQSLVL